MAKHNIFAIFCILILSIATQIEVSHGRQPAAGEDELLQEYFCLKNEMIAKIHFFAQDITGGPNGTVYEVARAAVSTDAFLSFGTVFVIDDVVTAGPGGDSQVLGKAQGIMASADRNTTAMAMNFNVVFTSGMYNGSTLSIAGRNQAFDQQRRLAVVGGTGVFRYSRGFTTVNTNSSRVGEDSVLYTVLEYNIFATYCPAM